MSYLSPSRREAAPRILPRLDPGVHSSWDERAPITRAQAEQFDRDGYLVLDNVLRAEEVAALQTSAAKLLADPAALEDETVITEPGGREVRSIFQLHLQSGTMARLAPADSPEGPTLELPSLMRL